MEIEVTQAEFMGPIDLICPWCGNSSNAIMVFEGCRAFGEVRTTMYGCTWGHITTFDEERGALLAINSSMLAEMLRSQKMGTFMRTWMWGIRILNEPTFPDIEFNLREGGGR